MTAAHDRWVTSRCQCAEAVPWLAAAAATGAAAPAAPRPAAEAKWPMVLPVLPPPHPSLRWPPAAVQPEPPLRPAAARLLLPAPPPAGAVR